ncbi:PREDICTED: probable E3 ubiquitin-protein ligase RHB1A [Nelumbo nucifera]|uniref:RING-type E3 ubiquitin transferase n=2 Tax=Nelumbo nucifera TaxID=4432 RepID=A0A1U7ZT78_NELNU|nr:PREDICTED: probable E3 ubiquitin-protein ligase RHB1A [Nelumbo nucifera]XP_010255289.1 PREDICTED: probable E3 ubiquitin-protein ligase RHB1A [Nelumbo nucifera]DAD18965.1 TPA_asm: hypothetical protein HUJ06_020428 [Nelumbo nucifera]
MGGCCCCSSRRSQLDQTYYYCPEALEERESLTAHHGAASALSTGLLVNANLETSIPDTYRAPPPPLPYDVDLGRPQTLPSTQEGSAFKHNSSVQTTNTEAVEETLSGCGVETLAACESVKESDCKGETKSVLSSPKESDVEPSKLSEPIVSATEEEDACPICLEEYGAENPKIITKCDHHFHLACILEWMERSDTCPVCDQEMIFNDTVNA